MRVENQFRWVLAHEGVEENETAHEQAKEVAERLEGMLQLGKGLRVWSMAKAQRRVTELKWSKTEKWWKANFNSIKWAYSLNAMRRMSKLLGGTNKCVVGRFLHQNVGHAFHRSVFGTH
jgi:hypothetical protein